MNDPFLEKHIQDVPDFPKPGIIFKDISPLLASHEARNKMTETLVAHYRDKNIDVVVGIESRGFLFGMLLANALNAKFVMIRKPGKLPGDLIEQSYQLEYGTDTIEIQQDAVNPNDRVLIHDDVLATGGTAAAAHSLLSKMDAQIIGYSFIIELDFLAGREKLPSSEIHSALHY